MPLRSSADERRAAAAAARSLGSYDGRVVISLRGDRSTALESGLERLGITPVVERSAGQTRYSFVAPDGHGREVVRELEPSLRRVDDSLIALRVP